MKTSLRVALVIAPAVLGVVAGILLWLAEPDLVLRISVAPALVVLELGVVVSVVLAVGMIWSRRDARRRRDQLIAGATQARVEHQAFLARLDHEMKNPLTAIRAALAAHGTAGSPHLEVADAQAKRLGSLVSDLRKLSDLQTRPLEREAVDLGEIVQEAVHAVNLQLQQAGNSREFAVHLPTVPWRIPAVQGDSDLLYLVVFNLLANAAKFTREGDRVEVRAGETTGRVWLEVADTGMGIPGEDLSQVWSELARAANARGVPGSGLGLPLVKIVVERHDGRVSIRSREGEGTAVRIELPVGQPELDAS